MAIEMHFAVWRPFGRQTRKASIIVLFTASMLLSLALALPTALYSKVTMVHFNSGEKGLCLEIWPSTRTAKYGYSIILMILQYFLPMIVMIGTYWHIAMILWRHVTPGEIDQRRDRRIMTSKKKGDRTSTPASTPVKVLANPNLRVFSRSITGLPGVS
ncbi:hypothetical protein FSP39_003918 [Pinctada imbricata]|uniref:G-protein coupled receptors family 1 profile domain-containing protein n=1 Tax=Pinctada imbricata TaxID=66713 RepID=A0AA88Y4R1_PINIB|nr:hypothetical protein FSP39_003918 [Pinctada imbricata]